MNGILGIENWKDEYRTYPILEQKIRALKKMIEILNAKLEVYEGQREKVKSAHVLYTKLYNKKRIKDETTKV